jgi:predicted membrane-bound spermidine synthase
MSVIYQEDNIEEFGVTNNWYNAIIKDSFTTKRGTKIEIIKRPKWGLACYMDNSIQSALIDERIYHEALVHPAMSSVTERKRVMIIGGGEGATAREVLKWPGVEHVDMFEWDTEVVELFRSKYSEWAQGAWSDPRLTINYYDIFEIIKTPPKRSDKYDVIIIDLFEPSEENYNKWNTLIKNLCNWVTLNGSIAMYAGMRNILVKEQSYQKLIHTIQYIDTWHGVPIHDLSLNKDITPYKVYIPSFSGESMFLLMKHTTLGIMNFDDAKAFKSHVTEDVWNSYKTINW